jgi:hypothetical protein
MCIAAAFINIETNFHPQLYLYVFCLCIQIKIPIITNSLFCVVCWKSADMEEYVACNFRVEY